MGWILHGHLLFAIAALVGWEHLDLFWPRKVLPDGLPLGGARQSAGLLIVGDLGRPVRVAASPELIRDWRHWLQADERVDSSECLAVPEPLHRRLLAQAQPRAGSGGISYFWAEMDTGRRLGPARCGGSGGLEIAHALQRLRAIRPVPCSRDVFVAHGLLCPGERRSRTLQSETLEDQAAYYPPEAAKTGKEGTVRVRVERDQTGSPIDCTVVRSSGVHDLDRQTCKLVGTDPAFTAPPQAGTDRTLDSPIEQNVKWVLPPAT
jgi:TonB family protein